MRTVHTRLVLAAALAVGAALAGCSRPEHQSPLHPFIYYLPNRVLDVSDALSVGVAVPGVPQLFPATVHVNAHATRAVQLGAGTTHGTFLGKGYHRRFAWGLYHDEISAGPFTVAHLRFSPASVANATDAEVDRVGMLLPSDGPFNLGYMDYWAVGAHVGLLPLAVSLDVHPIEVADALLGFLLIDICHDDY